MEDPEILDHERQPEQEGVYYSPTVILVFSVLFSCLFSSILMAMNLRDRSAKWQSVFFGLVYTVLCSGISGFLQLPLAAGLAINVMGGFLLNQLFWNRYIGRGTPFQPRRWGTPLLIGFGLTIALLALALSATGGLDALQRP